MRKNLLPDSKRPERQRAARRVERVARQARGRQAVARRRGVAARCEAGEGFGGRVGRGGRRAPGALRPRREESD